MNYQEFAKTYTPLPSDGFHRYTPDTGDIDLDNGLTIAHNWAETFSTTIDHYLSTSTLVSEKIAATVDEYLDWNLHYAPRLSRLAIGTALRDPSQTIHINTLSFHLLSRPTEVFWKMLTNDTLVPKREDLSEIQSWLAADAAPLALEITHLKKKEAAAGTRSGVVGAINGQLTEIDTYITLLEVQKNHPERDLLILPAPPRYEAGVRSANNADLLAIDRQTQSVRGIQAKTRITTMSSDREKYSHDTITLVDGYYDLGNSRAERHPGSGKIYSVAQPGLIAMDHLQRTPINDMPGARYPRIKLEHRRAKLMASELSRGRKSYIEHAARHLGERVLYDLYKD